MREHKSSALQSQFSFATEQEGFHAENAGLYRRIACWLLEPFNDWANVGLALVETDDGSKRVISYPTDELTKPATAWIAENFPVPPAMCPGDLNDDQVVDVVDLLALLGVWGADGPGADLAEPFDLVDVHDLLAILAVWGPCP